MCQKRNSRKIHLRGSFTPVRVDACLKHFITDLNVYDYETLACCCGHGRYNLSIVVKLATNQIVDLVSFKLIPRKTRFYKRDSEGFYFIPETIDVI